MVSRVRGTVHSIVSADIQDGGSERVDSKTDGLPFTDASVCRGPRGAAIARTEDTTFSPRIYGGHGFWVDGKRCDMYIGKTRVHGSPVTVSYTHLRAHETRHDLV